jgi:hypothetical protein
VNQPEFLGGDFLQPLPYRLTMAVVDIAFIAENAGGAFGSDIKKLLKRLGL